MVLFFLSLKASEKKSDGFNPVTDKPMLRHGALMVLFFSELKSFRKKSDGFNLRFFITIGYLGFNPGLTL
jgi:hypothetical protein